MKVQLSWDFPTQRTDGTALAVSDIRQTDIYKSVNGGAFAFWTTISAPSHSTNDLDTTPGPRVYRFVVIDKFLQEAAPVETNGVTMPSSQPAPPNPATNPQATVVA